MHAYLHSFSTQLQDCLALVVLLHYLLCKLLPASSVLRQAPSQCAFNPHLHIFTSQLQYYLVSALAVTPHCAVCSQTPPWPMSI